MTDHTKLIAQLRLGASISRDRNLNLDFAKVADESADKLEAAQAEIERLTFRLKLTSDTMNEYLIGRDAALERLAEIEAEQAIAGGECFSNGVACIQCGCLDKQLVAAAGASPEVHVPETDCGNIEAMQPNSCAYCTHPLFVGLKCKHCGRVVQPSQAPEGWQLVPVEPTEAMVEAGNKHTWPYPCVYPYKAMLSAAINAKGAACQSK